MTDKQTDELNTTPASEPTSAITKTPSTKFRRLYLVIGLATILSIALAAIFLLHHTNAPTAPGAASEDKAMQPTENSSSTVVEVSEKEMPQLTVEPVSERTAEIAEETTGKVAYNEERMTPVFTPYAGRVIELFVNKGDTVKAGQPLMIIEAPELIGVQNDLSAALTDESKSRIALDAVQKAAERARRLHEREAIATKDLQQAESDLVRVQAELDRAHAAVKAIESRLVMLGKDPGELMKSALSGKGFDQRLMIRAPIAGTVIDRKVGLGQYLKTDAADPLYLISDLSTLWVMADVYENWLPQIRVGAPVKIRVAAYPDQVLPAHISFINPTVDPITRTVHVRCTVANTHGILKPEMFAHIQIGSLVPQKVAAIPASAIVSQGADSFVFIEQSPHHFKRYQVHPTREIAGLMEVDDLKPGERVVTHGVMLLNMQVRASTPSEENKQQAQNNRR